MSGNSLPMTPPSRIIATPPPRTGEANDRPRHGLGFSFTIMYLVLPQFGTGSV